MDLTVEQFKGCMLGLATGDALGAPHEGGPVERLVWRFIGRTSNGCLRWTDDTQMSLDLAESLLADEGVCPENLAKRFGCSYRWSRGYGLGAARVLKRIRRGQTWEQASKSVYANGSYGNGAAMRAPVLALFYAHNRVGLIEAAKSSAMVTHAHPLGIEGAILIALAAQVLLERRTTSQLLDIIGAECQSPQIVRRMKIVSSWLETRAMPTPREVASMLGNGITVPTSCLTALYAALRHLDCSFDTMMKYIIACRGDVDTIGAMAGAFWGIVNGSNQLPKINLEARGKLEDMASRLYMRHLKAT